MAKYDINHLLSNNLFVLWFNVPVKKFSVMLGWSHTNKYYGELMCLAQGLDFATL